MHKTTQNCFAQFCIEYIELTLWHYEIIISACSAMFANCARCGDSTGTDDLGADMADCYECNSPYTLADDASTCKGQWLLKLPATELPTYMTNSHVLLLCNATLTKYAQAVVWLCIYRYLFWNVLQIWGQKVCVLLRKLWRRLCWDVQWKLFL